MVDGNKKGATAKLETSPGKDAIEKEEAPQNSLNIKEEVDDDEDEYEEDEDEDEYEEDEDEDEYEEEEDEEEEDDEEEQQEEKVNVGGNAVADTKHTKKERNDSGTLAVNGDKPQSSNRKKSKRVASMGMVFMCSSKTKTDCFRYKILGLPESKKDQVLKIYRGMRLFLFDVDLRLMYGIFKAAGPGGYNIEPNAFKSEFPSQVRFTVLDDCLPLAEESFKSVLKENYYSRNKFEGLLKSDQVKKLCKLFVEMGRGSGRKSRRSRRIESRRADESRRSRREERQISRAEEKRKRRARDDERRTRSPPPREKRRYTDYDRLPAEYDRPPVLYDREPLVSRYHHPPPPAMGSPVRLYNYDRPPLDIPPYIREHVPEPHSYRVINPERHLDRDRDRDHYLAYSREPPVYRDAVYTVPPEYPLVSRDYHHPPGAPTSEYRISGAPRVPSYRDVEIPSDYRSSAMGLPEYRSRTHYKY
ncbi:hypothetical protein E3N88_31949 [Mikania micrantha]|uniref:DCD domain-containing protein n=1 Tax=Mikania micrantha TaxID=192012 RepID=A0A5N6M744_9ASTR|nr:hypothetical protein E3N88_31949 [Mikania micrantha]